MASLKEKEHRPSIAAPSDAAVELETAFGGQPRLHPSSSIDLAEVAAQLDCEGFAVVPALLDPERLIRPVLDEYSILLDSLCESWGASDRLVLPADYHLRSFEERFLFMVEQIGTAYHQFFDITLPIDVNHIHADTPMHHSPAIFNVMRSEALLDALESLVGPEIYYSPVQHMRLKPPESMLSTAASKDGLRGSTFWHQDAGVLNPSIDSTEGVVTVWIPMTPATEENGCLLVAPGSHRAGLCLHCFEDPKRPGIPDTVLGDFEQVPIVVKPGDVLFMHKFLMHGSLPNRSAVSDPDCIRVSLDIRAQPPNLPTGRDERFPGWLARSSLNKEGEVHSADAVREKWIEAQSKLVSASNLPVWRWGKGQC